MSTAVEFDGSGVAVPRKAPEPAPQLKTGRYGIVNPEAVVPLRHQYSGGMPTYGRMFAEMNAIDAALRSEQAQLGQTATAYVAIYWGRDHGFTWLSRPIPFPNVIPSIEWRDGCPSCGSVDHVSCYLKIG